jgi:very-short-patch-repair endonuclease
MDSQKKRFNNMSASEELFAFQMKAIKLDAGMVREFKFHDKRKWRFDFAWPDLKIAVECEGVTSFGKTLGRHQTAKGYRGDLEKYNAATLLGWRVLRYDQFFIKFGAAMVDIEKLIKGDL